MKWISPFVAATFEVPMRAPPTEVICTNISRSFLTQTQPLYLFLFLSKMREKHQVYSHILKVDFCAPHFYSGTPLKYVHMTHSPNISSFSYTGPLLSSSVHPLPETTSYSFCSFKIAYFILIGQFLEAY